MVDSCLAHISLERDHPHAVLIRPLIVAGVWVVGALFAVAALLGHGWWEMPAVLVLVLAALGTWDVLQTRQTILRLVPDPRARPVPGGVHSARNPAPRRRAAWGGLAAGEVHRRHRR
jgi:hypothetical protein